MMRWFIGLLAGLLVNCACADALDVIDPWVPAVPPGQRVLVAYMTLQNKGAEAVSLVKVSSEQFKIVEMHHSVIEDGVARMLPQQELLIEAEKTLKLEPGGYHLMLMEPTTDLLPADEVFFTLSFAGQSDQIVRAVVRKRGAASAHGHTQH